MKEMWDDIIDVNAGPIATGDATIKDIGTLLFNEILDVCSGIKNLMQKSMDLRISCVFSILLLLHRN